jgi:hypothetical protein
MAADPDVRSIHRALDDGTLSAEDAVGPLARAAREAEALSERESACLALGAVAGRAWGASWTTAERAAFALLEVAREADTPREQVLVLDAMGRAFRNAWLLPYVHSRLLADAEQEEEVVAAAIAAAGGLGFPALEETLASTFLAADAAPSARLAAVAALGRMGAESAAERIAALVGKAETITALHA